MAAAAGLLAEGRTPSVGEIAAAADVSRRTVYLYFPSLEQLLADAALAAAARDAIEPRLSQADDAAERLEALVRALRQNAEQTERLGRMVIRHSLEPRAEAADEAPPRRGYRRIAWLEDALQPARAQLGEAAFERLVSALTLLVGWEPLRTLRDTRGLSPAQAEEISAWAAQALLAASLEQARAVADA